MRPRIAELRERREVLAARADQERRVLAAEYARITGGAERADGWIALARRVTPVAAVGAIAVGLLVGPRRIVRLLQAAAVPALLLRQMLGRSSASGDVAKGVLRFLARHRPVDEE